MLVIGWPLSMTFDSARRLLSPFQVHVPYTAEKITVLALETIGRMAIFRKALLRNVQGGIEQQGQIWLANRLEPALQGSSLSSAMPLPPA